MSIIGIIIISPLFMYFVTSFITTSLVFLLHPPITNLLGFSKELKFLMLRILFMSSSKINFGLTPSLFEFSIINAFEPILLSIQINSKLGFSLKASKPIEPQPAPISQITPFVGSSKSAKI